MRLWHSTSVHISSSWPREAEKGVLCSLATSVLLNIVLAFGTCARVGLDPLRCACVLARVLEPHLHELADEWAVIRVESAAKAEDMALTAAHRRNLRCE